jgi:hypothetical protein
VARRAGLATPYPQLKRSTKRFAVHHLERLVRDEPFQARPAAVDALSGTLRLQRDRDTETTLDCACGLYLADPSART